MASELDRSQAEPGASERKEETGSKSDDRLPLSHQASAGTPPVGEAPEKRSTALDQHYVSRILDEVLEEPESLSERRYKHPMLIDLALSLGLLLAVGGFTVGMFKMYLMHQAQQSITQGKYQAAIAILSGAPLPAFVLLPGPDTEELLSQALYMDAMSKLEAQDVASALKQLQQIKPGSRCFQLAQEIITAKYQPAETFLEGHAIQTEPLPPAPPRSQPPLLPGAEGTASVDR